MNQKPGQLSVVTEVSYCPFCERPRNLRREERHLGALVRMTLTCETCHRTLESTMTVAGADQPEPEKTPAPIAEPADKPAPAAKAVAAKAKTPAKAAAKSAVKTKTAATSRRTSKEK
jgi:uncharacterized membrane protein